MTLAERFKRLTLWNKLGVAGSIASLLGVVVAILWPAPRIVQVPLADAVNTDQLAEALASRLERRSHADAKPLHTGSSGPIPPPELVLILVDTSGSMRRFPVRKAIIEFVGTLRRQDLVGITAFSESAAEVVPFGDYTLETLRGLAMKLTIDGQFTDLNVALKSAARSFPRASPYGRRIVLITDADFNRPMDARSPPWQLAELSGINVEAVLFGDQLPDQHSVDGIPPHVKIWRWPLRQ